MEYLLNSLIKAQVLASLDKQVKILFIRAVHCDSLRSHFGRQNQNGLCYAGNFNVFTLNRFLIFIVVLAWDLNVHFWVVEVIVVQIIKILGEHTQLFVSFRKIAYIHFCFDLF